MPPTSEPTCPVFIRQQNLREVPSICMLGLDIVSSGSVDPRGKSAEERVAQTIHAIRGIATKAGGSHTNQHCPSPCAVRVAPRLAYKAKFHHLTTRGCDRLEALNRNIMWAPNDSDTNFAD